MSQIELRASDDPELGGSSGGSRCPPSRTQLVVASDGLRVRVTSGNDGRVLAVRA